LFAREVVDEFVAVGAQDFNRDQQVSAKRGKHSTSTDYQSTKINAFNIAWNLVRNYVLYEKALLGTPLD